VRCMLRFVPATRPALPQSGAMAAAVRWPPATTAAGGCLQAHCTICGRLGPAAPHAFEFRSAAARDLVLQEEPKPACMHNSPSRHVWEWARGGQVCMLCGGTFRA
jgi:hypothetical protein